MDHVQTIVRDGRRWRVRPDAAAPLLDEGWPLADPARLTAVKVGPRRTVSRCTAGGQGYYVKAYRPGGLLRALRARLGLGPARREWDALLAARAVGLDVPEPVALALGADETLVTREIPGVRRLDEYLFERYFEPRPDDPPYPGARPPELVALYRRRREPPPGTLDPRTLAGLLADLVHRLAEANLFLPDLHPGNVLVAGEAGAWRLCLVDLAEAMSPSPPEALLKHLVQLEHFFEPIATAAERRRCLRRLAALRPDAPDARVVARATAIYRQRFYRRRDRRTRRESKYFRRVAVGGWQGWATADWADAVAGVLAALAGATGGTPALPGAEAGGAAVDMRAHGGAANSTTPPEPTAAGGTAPGGTPPGAPPAGGPGGEARGTPAVEPLKDGRTSTVWRVRLADGRGLVLKRHNRAGERGLLGGTLPTSRSVRALRLGHALLVRGIGTARPAAALDLRRGGACRDTLLATETIEDAAPLWAWLRQGPAPAARRRLVWRLARMVQRMHDAGFSHRDLKAPNVLVAADGGGGPRPVLIDLDGARPGRRVPAGRRARDLMRLSVSLDEWGVARRTDRLRFLRAYLGPRGCPAPVTTAGRRRGRTAAGRRLRRWWRRIARLSARKLDALRRKHGTRPA